MSRFVSWIGAALLGIGAVSVGAEEAKPRKAFDAPVSQSLLANGRGGSLNVQVADQRLNSTVAGNVAKDVLTGGNTISEGAFSNSQGIPMVVQNSGNNVSIQNATVINVTVK